MRLKLFIVSLFMTVMSFAQEAPFNWMPIINAIAYVESGYNEKAVSPNGMYVGYLQIGKTMVQECNNILKAKGQTKRYTYEDRKNKEKSIEMFILIQEKYNPERSTEKAIRLWNGGPGYTIKGTSGYFNKVIKRIEKPKEGEEGQT